MDEKVGLGTPPPSKSVLNIGGRSKTTEIPYIYDGWNHVLLDSTPGPTVDTCMDARYLHKSPITEGLKASFDAVYCSHTLEHFERWDLCEIVKAIDWALKPEGWLELKVPDLLELAKRTVLYEDIDAQIYCSPAGPVTIGDLIYGYGLDTIENESFRHRNGFTPKGIRRALRPYFRWVAVEARPDTCELHVLAYRSKPTSTPYPCQEGSMYDPKAPPTSVGS